MTDEMIYVTFHGQPALTQCCFFWDGKQELQHDDTWCFGVCSDHYISISNDHTILRYMGVDRFLYIQE